MIDLFIEIIGGIFKALLSLIWELFVAIFSPAKKRKEEYDASFLKESELISRYNKGFSLNGLKHATAKDSFMNCMVLAPTGQGKTTTVAIPTLFNLAKNGHSVIINDGNGELLPATGGIFNAYGYELKVMHYSRPETSDGYNPMFRANDQSDLQKVASLLVRNALGDNQKDPFWSQQSILLITLMMRILKKQNPWFQNLCNVKLLLDTMISNSEAMDVLVSKCTDRSILTEYKNFVAMDKKLMVSIVSTCRSALSILSDPNVQKVTAFDSIDFESFRKNKQVLYIQNKTGEARYYSMLTACFFEQFFSHVMEKLPEKTDKNIYFVIDEAGSLYIPSLQTALSQVRKFRCGIMTIAQDISQFENLYSREVEAIKTNSWARIYFPGQSMATCNELEKLLGRFQFTDERGVKQVRSLMTSDEVRAMEKNTALIVCGSHRAIYTKMYPYYKNYKLRKYASLPVPELPSKLPFEELPLIPLPTKL